MLLQRNDFFSLKAALPPPLLHNDLGMRDSKTLLDNLFGGIRLLRPGTIHYALNRGIPDPAHPRGRSGFGGAQSGQGTASGPPRVLLISDQALSDDEIRQTDKIMLACRLELNARTVITAADFRRGDFPISEVDYFFLFGTGPSELGFNFELPVNRMISLNNAWWVKTVAVKTLIKSPETKTDLWKNGLQPHFQG